MRIHARDVATYQKSTTLCDKSGKKRDIWNVAEPLVFIDTRDVELEGQTQISETVA